MKEGHFLEEMFPVVYKSFPWIFTRQTRYIFNYPLAFFSFAFYISLIAPTDPPENLTVQDSSYTWLLISWNHSRPYFSRNEVEGFLININENGGLFNNSLSVQRIPEEKNISGLKENTEYCIKVKAVTTGGLGEESDELCAFTDQEDGKRKDPGYI